MVGYDGSLWEGRQLIYRSGATGGYDNGIQNNVGNIAVSLWGATTQVLVQSVRTLLRPSCLVRLGCF